MLPHKSNDRRGRHTGDDLLSPQQLQTRDIGGVSPARHCRERAVGWGWGGRGREWAGGTMSEGRCAGLGRQGGERNDDGWAEGGIELFLCGMREVRDMIGFWTWTWG